VQVHDLKEPFSQPTETLPVLVSLLNLWNVFPMNNEGAGVSLVRADGA
jgi:hypothetical protein